MRSPLLCLLFCGCASLSLAADDWPQFRGPTGQGHATATNLPAVVSDTENVTWKATLPGQGWSSPVVEGGKVWLTTAENDDTSLRALAVQLATGKLLHNVEVFAPASSLKINAKNSHASPTPVVDGSRVYVHFGTLGTACLSTRTAQILWTNTELQIDHREGAGSSPVICGPNLVVHCDGTDVQYIVALDKATGAVAWKTARSGPLNANEDFRKAYSTPLLIEAGGRRQIISPAADHVYAYDPVDGRELWKIDYEGFSNVPRPVFGGSLLYVCTGYMKPQLWAIRPGTVNDRPSGNAGPGSKAASVNLTQSHVAWKATKQMPANASPLLVGDEIYTVSDQGILSCLDARSGEEIWKQRIKGSYSASPLLADGKIYVASEEGDLLVIEPGRVYKELALNHFDAKLMASPAALQSMLLVRTSQALYRFEKK